jgi:hypothetical protein
MGLAQHCCPRLSLIQHTRVHSDLPHSTSPRADSCSLLQLSLGSNELSFSSACSRQLPPPRRSPVASRRSVTAAAANHLLQSTASAAAASRLPWSTAATPTARQSLVAATGHLLRSTASAVAAGRQLSLIFLVADRPCCRRRCLVKWTAPAATAYWCSFWWCSRSGQPLLPLSVSHSMNSLGEQLRLPPVMIS